jgi:hypothetical protein
MVTNEKKHTMKFYKLSAALAILIITFLLSGCVGELGCKQQQHSAIFNIPNLYSIINPKDTFHLNDTLWVRFQVPDSFSSSAGSCDIMGDTLSVGSQCVLSYRNGSDTPILAKHIFFEVGNNWNLKKSGSYYVVQFGIIIDNTSITGIGADSSTSMILNESVHSYPCNYPAYSGCPASVSGFYLNTTFQNGQGIYPLIVR